MHSAAESAGGGGGRLPVRLGDVSSALPLKSLTLLYASHLPRHQSATDVEAWGVCMCVCLGSRWDVTACVWAGRG